MSAPSMNEDDPLEDFARREITLDGVTKRVYVAGSGPTVIVMSEMPGISPYVARFARWVRDAGFTVYMPSLFGRDGAVPGAEEGMEVFQRACVSSEFRALAANESCVDGPGSQGLFRVSATEGRLRSCVRPVVAAGGRRP
jgi:Dienelactone hydrolase family